MTEKYIKINNLSVSQKLLNFINEEAIPGLDISITKFWQGFDRSVHELAPKNKKLLEERRKLQLEIDRWHLLNRDKEFKIKEYKNYLE